MVALRRKPSYRALHRYAENFEPLILDNVMHWLGREPQAPGWREEVGGIEIDKDVAKRPDFRWHLQKRHNFQCKVTDGTESS